MSEVTVPGSGGDTLSGAALREKLEPFVGKPVGRPEPSIGPDPVNQPMIRHWAAAFEDANPIYTDPEFAATTRHGGIVAPPLMLQTWTMPTPKITGMAERGGSPTESDEGAGFLSLLDEHGYVATLAANSEFEVDRYLRLGERVSSMNVLESISDEKTTRLGPGFFITWITTYRVVDEDGTPGEEVGRQLFRILKFKPDLDALGA